MGDRVTRRDFLDGFACAIAAGTVPGLAIAQAPAAGAADTGAGYPPGRTGYLGSRPQDFAAAHAVRDGQRPVLGKQPIEEHYDAVIVGAGIGGLTTAYLLRKARPAARILILDNHDEFGGHARRNEFEVDGRLLIGYGGSESMEGPTTRWSAQARALVAELGVDLDRLAAGFHVDLYPGMGLSSGLFFPREVYGTDRLVTGDPVRQLPTDVPAARHNGRTPERFLADCPVDESLRAKLLRLYTDTRDVLSGQSDAQKFETLMGISYRDYLVRYFGLDAKGLAMFSGRTLDLMASRIEAVPASYAMGCEYPGFQGLGLHRPPEGSIESDPYVHHFPDGNATLARLLVRRLVPGSAPGGTMEDIVTARFDYSRLDRPENDVRLRLSSTVVALANTHDGADLLYQRGGSTHRVSAGRVVFSGYSAMLPYLCSDLGDAQRKAVAQQVKAPLVYVNVALRNWQSWAKCGVHYVNNPAGFYSHLKLDYPVSLGAYRFPTQPSEPMLLHLIHVPWPEGPVKDLRSAWREGRRQVYARRFEEFEHHARDELTRMFAAGGFDAGRDIAAITVNRWGHGYAYDWNPLYDPYDFDRVKAASHTPLGHIHFAGTDADWMAYAHVAIDSAYRVAGEIQAA